MGVKIISVSGVGKNEISHFKINEKNNNFMGNLYDHGLSIFGSQVFFK